MGKNRSAPRPLLSQSETQCAVHSPSPSPSFNPPISSHSQLTHTHTWEEDWLPPCQTDTHPHTTAKYSSITTAQWQAVASLPFPPFLLSQFFLSVSIQSPDFFTPTHLLSPLPSPPPPPPILNTPGWNQRSRDQCGYNLNIKASRRGLDLKILPQQEETKLN